MRVNSARSHPMSRRVTVADTLDMSLEERLKLVHDIWDSIALSPQPLPLTDADRAELDRRLLDYEKDPSAGDPWEVVRARIEARRGTRGSLSVLPLKRI